MRKARLVLLVPALLLVLTASACSRYHRVTDTVTGKVYYTGDLTREKNFQLHPDPAKRSGVVHFTDARTQSTVTLQSARTTPISQTTFNAATQGE